jgi:hypothetical protein
MGIHRDSFMFLFTIHSTNQGTGNLAEDKHEESVFECITAYEYRKYA